MDRRRGFPVLFCIDSSNPTIAQDGVMVKLVYLSSTMEDLGPFRTATAEALTKLGFLIKDSYRASPNPPVTQCLQDVADSDIYLGIFAGHYGSCPDGFGGKSITELEYRKAVELQKPCFIFIRDLKVLVGLESDALKGDFEAATKVNALRSELQQPDSPHTPAFFTDSTDLALKVTQALQRVPADAESQRDSLFNKPAPHPGQLHTGLLIVGIRGCDDAAVARLGSALPDWSPAGALYSPEAAQAGDDRLTVDQSLAYARCAALLLSPAGLSRLTENPAGGEALVKMLAARLGHYTLLLDGLPASALPVGWPAPAASFPVGQWLASGEAAIGGELVSLVQGFPLAAAGNRDVTNQRLVGLAYSVLAMNRAEADLLAVTPDLVRDKLGGDAYTLFAGLAGAGDWVSRYGPRRYDWQPFGNGSVRELLADAVRTLNTPRSRTPRDNIALRGNDIRLRYYPFEPEVFGQDAPDWPLLEAMRDRGCLVLVDELSTLHPSLCGRGDVFLSDPAVTVATLSGLDPAICSLDTLIRSPQRIAMLVDRFSNKLDPRCELAINNKARMRRWLRQCLPEALAGSDAQGANADRAREFSSSVQGRR